MTPSLAQPSDHTVLIVDDDDGICRLLASTLKRGGLLTVTARNGADALAWLKEHGADLMLLDLRLPDMSGQQLLEKLSEHNLSIPHIIISGAGDIRVVVDLMKQGARDFLVKDTQLLQLVLPVVQRTLKSIADARRHQETERRFTLLAEKIRAAFWVMPPEDERFVYLSPFAEAIFGLPLTQLLADFSSWEALILPEDLSRVMEQMTDLDAEPSEIEFRIRRPDGKVRWITNESFRLLDENGHILWLAGLARDITDRKELERRVLDVAEQERRAIGRDLHDDLCQRMAALKLRCGLAARALTRDEHPQATELGDIASAIADATALSRSIARGLAPVTLESDGLMAALRAFASSVPTLFNVPCHFECPEPVAVSDPTTAVHLFRITQELVANAVKHAAPTKIHLGLWHEAGRLILTVHNDGKPFHPPPAKPGMGWHFLHYRADAIGASLQFVPHDEPSGGTTATCLLSLS